MNKRAKRYGGAERQHQERGWYRKRGDLARHRGLDPLDEGPDRPHRSGSPRRASEAERFWEREESLDDEDSHRSDGPEQLTELDEFRRKGREERQGP